MDILTLILIIISPIAIWYAIVFFVKHIGMGHNNFENFYEMKIIKGTKLNHEIETIPIKIKSIEHLKTAQILKIATTQGLINKEDVPNVVDVNIINENQFNEIIEDNEHQKILNENRFFL